MTTVSCPFGVVNESRTSPISRSRFASHSRTRSNLFICTLYLNGSTETYHQGLFTESLLTPRLLEHRVAIEFNSGLKLTEIVRNVVTGNNLEFAEISRNS